MRKFLTSVSLFIIIINTSSSQGDINLTTTSTYNKDKISAGLLFNTNGWGTNFIYGKYLSEGKHRIFELALVGIKHPKEVKVSHIMNENQNRYIYGKENSFLVFRSGIGTQKKIFGKFDKESISLEYYYSTGVSLGLLKPIYYEVFYPTNDPKIYYSVVEKYDFYSTNQEGQVYSKASFLKGLNEIIIKPSLFIKSGVNFDYSNRSELLKSISTGIIIEAFNSKVPILATEDKNQFYFTLFANIMIGKIYSKRLKNID